MKRCPVVASSNIQSRGYDPATNTLEIEFKGGKVYSYSGVTPELWNDWLAADSAGGFFHARIKSNKDIIATKVEPQPADDLDIRRSSPTDNLRPAA